MDEIEQLKRRISNLEYTLNFFVLPNRYLFQRDIELLDGKSIKAGGNLGLKIGTATTQKLGFFNKTPVVQPASINAPSNPSAAYSQSEATSAVAAINAIRTALTTLGLTG